MRISVEEENLMCIFDTSSRTALINDIRTALPDFYEPELIEIAENSIKKLEAMTDAEFLEITFSPAYYNDERSD